MERTILVIGATGAMGRPVVQHLLGASEGSFRVRIFTRDPSSPQAQQLLNQGGAGGAKSLCTRARAGRQGVRSALPSPR